MTSVPFDYKAAFARINSWDNYTLVQYQSCPRKFEYSMLRRLSPKTRGRALDYGAALHEGLAAWYNTGAVGLRPALTKDQIVDHFAALTNAAKLIDVSDPSKLTKAEILITSAGAYAERLQLAKLSHLELRTELTVSVGLAFLPELADSQTGDRRSSELLDATLRGYIRQYEFEPFKVRHVEKNFAFSLPAGYTYAGIMDLVIDWHDVTIPFEHKTTSWLKSYGDQYVLNQQFTGYIHGGYTLFDNPGDHGVLNAIMTPTRKELIIKPEDFMRWPNIKRSQEQREEFLLNTVATIKDIERDVEREYFPMDGVGSGECNKYNGCSFKRICKCETALEKELVIANAYEPREWNAFSRDEGKALEVGGE